MNSVSYVERFTEAANANGEAFRSICDTSLKSVQQLMALNGDFARSLSENGALPLNGFDLREQMSAHTQRMQRAGEYFRELNEICVKVQGEFARVGTELAAEVGKITAAQIGVLFEASPLAASGFAEVFKSSLKDAASAGERMVNTSREITESSMTAALQALQAAPAESARASSRAARKSA